MQLSRPSTSRSLFRRLLSVAAVVLLAAACDESREMESAQGEELPAALEGQPREPLPPKAAEAVEETVRATAVEAQRVDEVTGYQDPVCGMKVEPRAQYTHTHENVTYGFCSQTCRERFEQQPAEFLAALEE